MLPLALVLLAAFVVRIHGINWDMGAHLHPDERMLIMVADRIEFFRNLNPDFFNYGTLPIYLLSGMNQMINLFVPMGGSDYDTMLILGRMVSVVADLLVIVAIYKVARLLFKNTAAALLSSVSYAVMFFPIQNTHFFIVDPFLNLFLLISVYRILKYIQKPGGRNAVFTGIPFAAAMACKVTAVLFYPVILAAFIFTFRRRLKLLLSQLILFHGTFSVFLFLFMPYAFINAPQFIDAVLYQSRMNNDAYVFPYTLQYVGALPYFYYLKNIALWGLGPVLFTASVAGILLFISDLRKSARKSHSLTPYIVPVFFTAGYLLYFLIIGKSAVKFMRYMLPLYPLFALFTGYVLSALYRSGYKIIAIGITAVAFLWTSLFLNIYTSEHTRIAATRWIARNIPHGSTIAIEHWDDRLPLTGSEQYVMADLTLYDQPDDDEKWMRINSTLERSDYMIIASNRLSAPLRKLRSCETKKACYPRTARYYDDVLSGNHRFKKIAEFAVFPHISIGNYTLVLPDQDADESFTVYDHPVITIFKKS